MLFVHLYGICILCGTLYGLHLLKDLLKYFFTFVNHDLHWKLFECCYLGGFVGGKLLFLLIDGSFDENIIEIIACGFSLLGALIGSMVALLYYAYKQKLSPIIIGTLMPICALPVMFLGRIGCYFASCCCGSSRIPLQLVSSGWYFLCFTIGYCLIKNKKLALHYNFTGLYIFLISLFGDRFILDFLRSDRKMLTRFLSYHQVITIVFIIWCLVLIFYNKFYRIFEKQ